MTDEFEPRLGKPGRDTRKPPSQLKAVARLARQGKPHAFGRTKLAPGSVWSEGRGKGAAAVTRHWRQASQRRVFVKATIAPARGKNTGAFSSHIKYLLRDGTDEDGNSGTLYDRDSDDVDARAFKERSRNDPWQFRIIVSPEDSGEIEDSTTLIRKIMQQVERDVGTRVDWVAVNHYNTPKPHTHIVVRGRTDGDTDIIIARKYLMYGLRNRAEDIVTDQLGPRDWRELSVSRQREAAREQLTSIDEQLSRSQSLGKLKLDPTSSRWEPYGLAARAARLQQLEKLGLAKHVYGPEWRLAEGWKSTLDRLGSRNDVLQIIAHAAGNRNGTEHIQQLETVTADKWVTGRLVATSRDPRGSPDPLLIVDGTDGRTWLSHIDRRSALQLPEPGGIISVSLEPVQATSTRLSSRAATDSDVSGFTLRMFVNSWLPVDQLVARRAFTWLDELSDDQPSDHSAGFGAEVRAAKAARQIFLKDASLDLTAFEDLQRSELRQAAQEVSARTGKRYTELAAREVFRGNYVEHVDLSFGRFAVIAGETRFTFAPMSQEIASQKGQSVLVEQTPLSVGNALWRSRGIER